MRVCNCEDKNTNYHLLICCSEKKPEIKIKTEQEKLQEIKVQFFKALAENPLEEKESFQILLKSIQAILCFKQAEMEAGL